MVPAPTGKPIQPAMNVANLSDDGLDTYTQEKVDKLTGNPSYPELVSFPELEAVIAAQDAYLIARGEADDGNSIATENKNLKRTDLENKLTILALRCAVIANGNELVFISSGFDVKKPSERHGIALVPQGLIAFDAGEGNIGLEWNPVPEADSFVIQITETPNNPASWTAVPAERGGASTRSETVITGLVSVKKYWLRAASVNSAGVSFYSNPATHVTQ